MLRLTARRGTIAAVVLPFLLSGCVSQGKYNELRTRYETETEGMRAVIANLERAKSTSETDAEYYRTLAGQKDAESEALKAKLKLAELSGGEWEAKLRGLHGGPGMEILPGGKGVRFDAELLFAPGSATLSRGGEGALDPLVEVVQREGATLEIDGHTDDDPIKRSLGQWKSGSNFELGAHRALAVLLHLQKRGVSGDRMFLASYGEHRPLDPSNKKRNRRVEIYFFKEKAAGGGGGGETGAGDRRGS